MFCKEEAKKTQNAEFRQQWNHIPKAKILSQFNDGSRW